MLAHLVLFVLGCRSCEARSDKAFPVNLDRRDPLNAGYPPGWASRTADRLEAPQTFSMMVSVAGLTPFTAATSSRPLALTRQTFKLNGYTTLVEFHIFVTVNRASEFDRS